jgi:hypothetical protein
VLSGWPSPRTGAGQKVAGSIAKGNNAFRLSTYYQRLGQCAIQADQCDWVFRFSVSVVVGYSPLRSFDHTNILSSHKEIVVIQGHVFLVL